MDEGACGEFTTDSMVRGHHVYQEVWTPITGEYLVCAREEENSQDRYAVAVLKHDEIIVGKLSRLPDQPRKLRKFSPSNDLPCTVLYQVNVNHKTFRRMLIMQFINMCR